MKQHLWPNKFMADGDPKFKDFCSIYKDTNWLHSTVGLPLGPADKDVPTTIQYFENMLEAMARSCSGEVVIMSQTPGLMSFYMYEENIWKNMERPAPEILKKQGKITRFLIVDYNDPTQIWVFNIAENQQLAKVSPGDLLSRSLHQNETAAGRLLQRAACESSGLAQVPPQGDPFSDNYALFV